MTEDKGILIKNIYHMLAYAFKQLRSNNYEDIEVEDFEEIYDLFAEILSKGIAYQLKQGLHREYVEHAESLATLRGKLEMPGTIRNFTQQRRQLNCTYDVLSVDNTFNQILKAAINILIHQKEVKDARRHSLRRLLLFFDEVADINPSTVKWSSLRYDRNSKTYQMLHYLCYFIMDNLLLSTDAGKYRMRSFTDEQMNMLFEHFVLEYYRKHHPRLKAASRQVEWNIDRSASDTAQLPILQTDILLAIGERTLIIDTKYYSKSLVSHYNRKTIHSANLYQIYTYVTNHDAAHLGNVDGMLLYAKTQEEVTPDGHIALNDGNKIFFRTLDLNQSFDGIKAQLDNLILST